jgi:hypothetical protein
VKSGSSVKAATSLALALSGLLACACGSGGTGGASDGGAGGSDGAATGTKFGAVIVETPGPSIYFASAAFSDAPRLLQPGEHTSLDFGVGEPEGCAKSTVGGCQVYRCPKTIEATPSQFVEPNVGAINITWPPASGPDGGGLRSPVTLGPLNCYSLFWQTGTPATRFGFSAAGGTIPAFPETDVDVPQLFEVTQFNGNPLGPPPPPSVPRAAGLRLTWTGGTADAVFVIQQHQIGSDNDLRAVCRVAASAGSFTFSSSVLGEFQPGDAQLDGSAVSSKTVAAGDYATTLAIGAHLPWHFPFTIE